MPAWTEEEDAILRNNKGNCSAAMLAALLPNRSRNSVIGRMHRLHIPLTDWTNAMHKRRTPKALTRLPNVAHMAARREREQAQQPQIELPSDHWAPLPGTTPVGLLDIGPNQCRWPLGGSLFIGYCGCVTHDGPYCPTHAHIARGQRQSG